MINLKTISFRNFLSYGNVETTLQLDKFTNTLIASSSGSGKSVFVDAIAYCLYGKPYRNIRLPQLINSINLKGMLTTIEFNIGSIEYKIIRGMKPGIFEIYQNGKLLDQEAATRDYQGYLEKNILKINYKTFCQVVLIGTAGFTPFMQLPAGQRRDVIEDVLDIAIFSEMNTLLKQRILVVRDSLIDINNKLDAAKKDAQNQTKIIKLMEEHHADKIMALGTQSKLVKASILELYKKIKTYEETIEKCIGQKTVKLIDISREIFLLEDTISRLGKSLSTIDKLESCPTCLQCVTKTHKNITKEQTIIKIEKSQEELEKYRTQQAVFTYNEESNKKLDDNIKTIKISIGHLQLDIRKADLEIETITDNIKSLTHDTAGLEDEKNKLKAAAALALEYIDNKKELLEERAVQEVVVGLLKDSGIKSAIIREYIPILNRLINKYLAEFGFFIDFTLDEGFNEKIMSRGRDDFSYNSFSEGEKTKIDLSILFAFRQVTEMKNSANCSLLFLDEMGDNALDINAKEAFVNILSNLGHGNNFVISHNAPDTSMYESVISISKKNDFSVLEFV